MTRLVAMRILPNQPGDISLAAPRGLALRREQLIELACECAWTTHQAHQPTDVLRRKERVLPRVRFRKRKRDFTRIERLYPVAVRARPHETTNRIENVPVRLRPRKVTLVVVRASEHFRALRDAPA